MNKTIRSLKIALTTGCNLSCRYCFVPKTNRVMRLSTAKKILGFFLRSPGNAKLLKIYGGEPLTQRKLLKEVIEFAFKEAKKNKKVLDVAIASNGLLLDEEILLFLRRKKVKLAISFDGQRLCHNHARVYPGGKGSFETVLEKLRLALGYTGENRLSALLGVQPKFARDFAKNISFIYAQGVRNVNIEIIQGKRFNWSGREKTEFARQLAALMNFIFFNISKQNFIFLTTVNRELSGNALSEKNSCLFYENLEFGPDGEIYFSPFLLYTDRKKEFSAGNINSGFDPKLVPCLYYGKKAVSCVSCRKQYCGIPAGQNNSGIEVKELRNRYSIKLAKLILQQSRVDRRYALYIEQAKERVFE